MKTIQILNEDEILKIHQEAVKKRSELFESVIHLPTPDANVTILNAYYDLYRELLTAEQSCLQERNRLMQQAKKREEKISELTEIIQRRAK